jgi:hypothetical protein
MSNISRPQNFKKDENFDDITEENSMAEEKEECINLRLLDTVYTTGARRNNLRNHQLSEHSIDSFEIKKPIMPNINNNTRTKSHDYSNNRDRTATFNDLEQSDTFMPTQNNKYETESRLISVFDDISHIKTSEANSIKKNIGKPGQRTISQFQSVNISTITNDKFAKRRQINQSTFNISINDNCEHCVSLKQRIIKISKEKMDMNLEIAKYKKEIEKKKTELDNKDKKLSELIKQSEKDSEYILKQEKEMRRLYSLIEKYAMANNAKPKNNNKENLIDVTQIIEDFDLPVYYKKQI